MEDNLSLKQMIERTFVIADHLTGGKLFSSSFKNNEEIKELESLYNEIMNILNKENNNGNS